MINHPARRMSFELLKLRETESCALVLEKKTGTATSNAPWLPKLNGLNKYEIR